jgi:ferrous iron transport protein B
VKKIAFIGNPNCGKTTLFNAITHSKRPVANWAGVTVDTAEAPWGDNLVAVDLPGCYSICHADTTGATDERIAANYLFQEPVDIILHIIDASQLTRAFYLTSQLLELSIPIIIVINKIDLLTRQGKTLHLDKLRQLIQVPHIIACQGNSKADINALQTTLTTILAHPLSPNPSPNIRYPSTIAQGLSDITQLLDATPWKPTAYAISLNLLAGSQAPYLPAATQAEAQQTAQSLIDNHPDTDLDIMIAQSRYDFIRPLVKAVVSRNAPCPTQQRISDSLDRFLTHKYLGIPCLMLVLYGLFFFALQSASILQPFCTQMSELFFVTGLATLLQHTNMPSWIMVFLVQGLGQGITTLASFIPIVFTMYYSIGMLEESGYMPRAAYVTDRFMRLLHLPGKAFIPLIIGFSCNVPAILATRTLECTRDRIIAGIMTPFMSCNARLAVFAIFAAAFFPLHASSVVFVLYMTGVIAAILTGLILCRAIIPGQIQPLVMELPPYQIPRQHAIISRAWSSTGNFIYRVGKLIILLSALMSLLGTYTITTTNGNLSLLAYLGKGATSIFGPIGITDNNWPAAVAILSGFMAKETVIITLSQLYHSSALNPIMTIPTDFWLYAQQTIMTACQQLITLQSAPSTDYYTLSNHLHTYFGDATNAFAYLLFNLLYMPCLSTIIAFAKEVHWHWALFTATWSLSMAYLIAHSFLVFTHSAPLGLPMMLIILMIAGSLYLAKQMVKSPLSTPGA